MFIYKSPVGTFWIKPNDDGRFVLGIDQETLVFIIPQLALLMMFMFTSLVIIHGINLTEKSMMPQQIFMNGKKLDLCFLKSFD